MTRPRIFFGSSLTPNPVLIADLRFRKRTAAITLRFNFIFLFDTKKLGRFINLLNACLLLKRSSLMLQSWKMKFAFKVFKMSLQLLLGLSGELEEAQCSNRWLLPMQSISKYISSLGK
jgi:hypothetical protein